MEKQVVFMIFGITLVHGNQNKEFFDDNVYITNETSYSDIPLNCRLFGASWRGNAFFQHTKLNVSYNGRFWIGAKTGFKQKINPIGIKVGCGFNENVGISLDDCNKKCKQSKFFHHNEKHCTCATDDSKDEGIANVVVYESIISPQHPKDCLIYERVNSNKEPTCDTYKKQNDQWLFGSEICSKKKNYSYICVKGNKEDVFENGPLTWKEAYRKCKHNGQDLIQTMSIFRQKYKKSNKTYWVAFFQRLEFFWGTVDTDDVCVAANIILNGSILFEPISCTVKLPSLCHSFGRTREKRLQNSEIRLISISVAGGFVVFVLVLLAALMHQFKYRRDKKLKHMAKIISQNADVPRDIVGSTCDSAKGTASCYSAYSLAEEYGDPICYDAGKIVEDQNEYDYVNYQRPVTVNVGNNYDQITENYYQLPYQE